MVKLSYFRNAKLYSSDNMGLVWNLFANFGKEDKVSILHQSKMGYVDRFDFTDSLISKAIDGGIDLQQHSFNLKAYDYTLKHYQDIAKFKKLEKEVYLVNEIDKGGNELVKDGYGEYSESRLVEEDDSLSLIEYDIDYQLAWANFPNWYDTLLKSGYSLVYLLLSVIEGSEEARVNLSNICKEDENFRDWLESLFIPDKMPHIIKSLNEFKELGYI